MRVSNSSNTSARKITLPATLWSGHRNPSIAPVRSCRKILTTLYTDSSHLLVKNEDLNAKVAADLVYLSEHYSKRIGRPFRNVLYSQIIRGRRRILHLECGHTVERYVHKTTPKRVRCMQCPTK